MASGQPQRPDEFDVHIEQLTNGSYVIEVIDFPGGARVVAPTLEAAVNAMERKLIEPFTRLSVHPAAFASKGALLSVLRTAEDYADATISSARAAERDEFIPWDVAKRDF